jgi:hypothetical protein
MDRIIGKLRDLNEPVPKPLRLPSHDEIQNIQIELGVKFHPDYVRYLLEASDVVFGSLEPATIPVDSGHTYIGEVATSAWEMGVSKTVVPIAEDNGDYYCMNEAGEVLYWSHDRPTDERWPSLENWIQEVWINEN